MNMNKKGFTLIEMLIVIVIIGILAAALIPRLTAVQGRARDVARKSDLQQIGTALATYNLDNGIYPVAGTETAVTTTGLLSGLVNNELMNALPVETYRTNIPYLYRTWDNGGVFAMIALSEGGGINANWAGTGANGSAPSGTAFILPTSATSPTTITNVLCTAVNEGTVGHSTGAACSVKIKNFEARYVYVN